MNHWRKASSDLPKRALRVSPAAQLQPHTCRGVFVTGFRHGTRLCTSRSTSTQHFILQDFRRDDTPLGSNVSLKPTESELFLPCRCRYNHTLWPSCERFNCDRSNDTEQKPFRAKSTIGQAHSARLPNEDWKLCGAVLPVWESKWCDGEPNQNRIESWHVVYSRSPATSSWLCTRIALMAVPLTKGELEARAIPAGHLVPDLVCTISPCSHVTLYMIDFLPNDCACLSHSKSCSLLWH